MYYTVGKKFPKRKLNYELYLSELQGRGDVVKAVAYGTQLEDEAYKFISCLKHIGFEAKFKQIRQFQLEGEKVIKRIDWSVGMAVDVMKHCERLKHTSHEYAIVIGSNDSGFIPLVEHLKEQGFSVGVYGAGLPKDLREVCNFYIEVEESMLENETPITA